MFAQAVFLVVVALYLLFISNCMTTKNFRSAVVFNYFPMVLGVIAAILAAKNFGVFL